ncbi:unnamed protein product [Oikopleura dioica]|uniref:FZ domain-containing protein n=1 Tax=Oikopleura dioica TaxID=34765 RepID=E4XES4_OIKDI|nr:unnamed protein product [Oikopleura dioica]
MFICSALSPACVDNDLSGTLPYLIPVPPCRELCELVTSSCAPLISEFDIQWPAEFSCDRLPRSSEAQCIPPHDLSQPLPFQLSWTSTEIKEENSFSQKEEIAKLCPAEQITENEGVTYAGIKGCTGPCEPKETTQTETKLVRLIVGIVAAAGSIASCFSITCFYIDKKRFQYPEKPAVFFAFCYAGICLIVLVGIVSPFRIACASNKLENIATGEVFEQKGLINGIDKNTCTVIFMSQFYLARRRALLVADSDDFLGARSDFQMVLRVNLASCAFLPPFLLDLPRNFDLNRALPQTRCWRCLPQFMQSFFHDFFKLGAALFSNSDHKIDWEEAVLQGSNLRPGFVFILLEKLLPLLPAFAPLVWAANRKSLERWGSSTASSVLTNSSFVGSGKGSETSLKSRKKAESIVSERSSRADASLLGRIPTVPDNLLV